MSRTEQRIYAENHQNTRLVKHRSKEKNFTYKAVFSYCPGDNSMSYIDNLTEKMTRREPVCKNRDEIWTRKVYLGRDHASPFYKVLFGVEDADSIIHL